MIIEGGDFFDDDPDRGLVHLCKNASECYCEGCFKEIEPGTVILAGPSDEPVFHGEACLRRYQENYVRNYPFDPYLSTAMHWAWSVPRRLALILSGHHRPDEGDNRKYRRCMP